MKFKFILLLIALSFITCKKNSTIDVSDLSNGEIKIALLNHFNGDWHFLYSTRDNSSNNSATLIDGEIWTINGDDLNIVRKSPTYGTNIPMGKHTLSVVEDNNGLIFLLIDEEAFAAINLSENRMSLNTGKLPNESVSHALTHFFEKEN